MESGSGSGRGSEWRLDKLGGNGSGSGEWEMSVNFFQDREHRYFFQAPKRGGGSVILELLLQFLFFDLGTLNFGCRNFIAYHFSR